MPPSYFKGVICIEVFIDITVIFLVVLACITDIRKGILPNWCNVSIFFLGVASRVLCLGVKGIPDAMLGVLGLAVLYRILSFLGLKIHAGDLKLIFAIGAYTGLQNLMYLIPILLFISGLMELAYLICKKKLFSPGKFIMHLKNEYLGIVEPMHKPQGPFIGLPFIVYVFMSRMVIW